MKAKVFCKNIGRDKQTFYLTVNGSRYYLFTQDFRISVKEYFEGGAYVSQLFNGTGRSNIALCKTKDKITNYIKYIEREFDLRILKAEQNGANNVV